MKKNNPELFQEASLHQQLKIDKFDLDRELRRQASRYAYWASIYSDVAAKVDLIQEKLDIKEADLFIKYSKAGVAKRATDLKFYVTRNSEYLDLKRRLRRWKNAERFLKYTALKGFEQRTFMLQALAANKRREWDSEINTKKKHREEE